jgi:hypothetical protein
MPPKYIKKGEVMPKKKVKEANRFDGSNMQCSFCGVSAEKTKIFFTSSRQAIMEGYLVKVNPIYAEMKIELRIKPAICGACIDEIHQDKNFFLERGGKGIHQASTMPWGHPEKKNS